MNYVVYVYSESVLVSTRALLFTSAHSYTQLEVEGDGRRRRLTTFKPADKAELKTAMNGINGGKGALLSCRVSSSQSCGIPSHLIIPR